MTPILISRHQKNGAVIARCSQPEISWWGWRNTDDEYLVTSIAKACQMDSGAKGTCGAPACQQRGEAPDSSDSDFGKVSLFTAVYSANPAWFDYFIRQEGKHAPQSIHSVIIQQASLFIFPYLYQTEVWGRFSIFNHYSNRLSSWGSEAWASICTN